MKEILSITELAKLREVTSETLRHYDRIGLLKPYHIDEISKERYYSIFQYEKLGTIKELKQMGLSLKEIKEYFENRNVDTTQILLSKGLNEIDSKTKELNILKAKIEDKLEFLSNIDNVKVDYNIEIKSVPIERFYILSKNTVKNEVELSYQVINLEKIISKSEPYLPIFASNRYVGMYLEAQKKVINNPIIGIQIEKNSKNDILKKKIPKGKYLTLTYQGDFWDGKTYAKDLLEYGRDKNLLLDRTIIQIQWLDYTFIENKKDMIYELQCKISE